MGKEEILKSQAHETERVLLDRISDLTAKSGRTFLGRDRAYRRYWVSDSVPGLYVEHDDENVGECLPQPTPFNPNAAPLDEATALIRVRSNCLSCLCLICDRRTASPERNKSLCLFSL